MKKLRLVQLPVPPPSALAATGNVPLAAGSLAGALHQHGVPIDVALVAPEETDALGDAQLADRVARDEPDYLGLSLYLWNTERSLHLAREVKRRSPRTQVIVGGPEVSADNPFVLQQAGYDLAVTGEAEESFAALMHALAAGRDPRGLPGVAVRGPLGLGAFGPAANAGFPLTAYPSPYITNQLNVEAERSTYIETVRGCRSHCTFCFYPRSSNVLRTLDVPQSAQLVRALKEKGAREVVFLDPTFNHRPQFDELLSALIDVNADRQLTCFAEVRAEGLTPEHARKLKRAGFDRLEIGLQSVNRGTLKQVRRGGSPEKVAEAAKMLHGEGIELLVDLIIGLPGDTPSDVLRGMDFLEANGLASEAQVFPLSLLPGTAMRSTAREDGVEFDGAPPYRVQRTATFSEEQLRETLFEAEARLSRRLDEWPRPHLIEPARDGFLQQRPGARHEALWFRGDDLHARRHEIARAIDAQLAVDPYCTLDVVLAPAQPFPLDLVDLIRARFRAAPQSYSSRALALRGEDLQRRIAVVTDFDAPDDWTDALRSEHVQVFRDQTIAEALTRAERLGNDLPSARIDGDVTPLQFEQLAEKADPDSVAFTQLAHEMSWQRRILGLADTR